jgi:hypothetical protein
MIEIDENQSKTWAHEPNRTHRSQRHRPQHGAGRTGEGPRKGTISVPAAPPRSSWYRPMLMLPIGATAARRSPRQDSHKPAPKRSRPARRRPPRCARAGGARVLAARPGSRRSRFGRWRRLRGSARRVARAIAAARIAQPSVPYPCREGSAAQNAKPQSRRRRSARGRRPTRLGEHWVKTGAGVERSGAEATCM